MVKTRSSYKMPGLKKLKKGKKFNYGRNRSRVRKQQEKTSKFNVALKVDCQAMKVRVFCCSLQTVKIPFLRKYGTHECRSRRT